MRGGFQNVFLQNFTTMEGVPAANADEEEESSISVIEIEVSSDTEESEEEEEKEKEKEKEREKEWWELDPPWTPQEEERVIAACPGVVASPRAEPDAEVDEVWGSFRSMAHAWAGDDDVRYRAATGGVLTALGMHLVATGQVAFVLHVAPDPGRPLHTRWVMSESPGDVLDASGSRYGPTAPLAGIGAALDREAPFAIIAKPCDLTAVHSWSQLDERVDRWCRCRLAAESRWCFIRTRVTR